MNISSAEHSKNMATYLKDGVSIAARINNKGPLLLDENGKLQSKILKAYEEYGFYIFENVINENELEELRVDAQNMIERAPATPGAKLDKEGRPALGRDFAREPYTLSLIHI